MLGAQISTIREIMQWTQEDLSNLLGISRPVLINIEKDPTKLSKTVAFALFTVTSSEFSKRKQLVIKEIEIVDFTDEFTAYESLKDVKWGEKPLWPLIITGLGASLVFGPVLGPLAVAYSYLSGGKNKDSVLFEEKNISVPKKLPKESKTELKKSVIEVLDNKEKEVLKCFGLDSWDSGEFVRLIEMGELEQ
jgi:DNA-binding XRE family transcriptional regulator